MPRKERECAVQVCCRKKGEGATISLFSFPPLPNVENEPVLAVAKRRIEVWKKKINLNDSEKLKGKWICNQHFFTGQPSEFLDYDHPDWAPTLKLNDNDPITPAQIAALREKLRKHIERKRQESSEDEINKLSVEELKEKLMSSRKKINDLTVQLALETEKLKRLSPSRQFSQNVPANQTPCWKILENIGKRGKSYLLDGLGHKMSFAYLTGDGIVTWRCTKKKNGIRCSGFVRQLDDDEFVVERWHTICKPIPNLERLLLLKVQTKQLARKGDVLETPMKLVKPILVKSLREYPDLNQIPKIECYSRTLGETRRKLCPLNPEDLFFEINQRYIPSGFLRQDIVVEGHSKMRKERHLIFGTDRQTTFLKEAKCWYVDRTCRFINKPFEELLSIHCVYSEGSEEDLKDAPLLYVFMSSRTTKDYTVVFEKILEMLDHDQRVKEIVFNFHESILESLKEVFPSVSLYSSPFQWSQTIFLKFKELGLISLYEHSEGVQKICSRLFSLHLLPTHDILEIFSLLKAKAGELILGEQKSQLLLQFFEYVENTWIKSSVWSPKNWSVFMHPVTRTDELRNHLVEEKLISIDNTAIDFYQLVPCLYKLTKKAIPQGEVRLVTQKEQARILTNETDKFSLALSLYKLWDSYNNEQLDALNLLKLCTTVFMEHNDFCFLMPKNQEILIM